MLPFTSACFCLFPDTIIVTVWVSWRGSFKEALLASNGPESLSATRGFPNSDVFRFFTATSLNSAHRCRRVPCQFHPNCTASLLSAVPQQQQQQEQQEQEQQEQQR